MSVDFYNWTWESSKGRVQSPASSGVSPVSLVFQTTQFRGVGASQQHLLMIQQPLEGVFSSENLVSPLGSRLSLVRVVQCAQTSVVSAGLTVTSICKVCGGM